MHDDLVMLVEELLAGAVDDVGRSVEIDAAIDRLVAELMGHELAAVELADKATVA